MFPLLASNAVIFSTEGGAKSWHGRTVKTTNQRKGLVHVCFDWEVSADHPEWDRHLSVIKDTEHNYV